MNNELNSIGLDKKPSDTTVVVAMSGGVDSSTVAGMMKKEGYKVIGITLKLYNEGKEVAVTTQPQLPFWDAPENKQPYFMQVVGLLKQENWKKLKTISYAWHESQPESIEAHSNFALALFKLGDTNKSEEEFKKVAKKIQILYKAIYKEDFKYRN